MTEVDVSHQCIGPRCPTEIPDYRLACEPHWRLLPVHLRHAIAKAWNRRRRRPDDDAATTRHLELAQDAFTLLAGAAVEFR